MKKTGLFFAGAFAVLAFVMGTTLHAAQIPEQVVEKALRILEDDYLYTTASPEECRNDIEAMLSWELAYEQGENPSSFSHEMQCLDPYSGIFTPRITRERTVNVEGLFGGIGLSFKKESSDSNRALVVEVFEGNPAEKTGVRAGDILLRARDDGEENFVEFGDFNAMPEKLRGQVGSKVYLIVERDGVELALPVMTREVIVIKAVKAKVFYGFGYVSISSFTERVADELDDALISFEKQGISRVVLDLRGNPGGILESVREMLYSFSSRPEDIMLTTRSRHDEVVSSIRSPYEGCKHIAPSPCLPFAYLADGSVKMPGRFENLTLVILINGHSASASEVFAGTMKDWAAKAGKTMIVGQNSFGKGVVQAIISLEDGFSLSLTIAEYLVGNAKTPVHGIGISPDYIVEDTRQFSEETHTTEDTLTDKDEQFLAAVFALFLLSPVP